MLDGDVVERPCAGPDPRGRISQRPFQGEGGDVQPASSILEALPCGRKSVQLAHESLGLGDIDREPAGVNGDPERVAVAQLPGELGKRRSADAPADTFDRYLAGSVLPAPCFDGEGIRN